MKDAQNQLRGIVKRRLDAVDEAIAAGTRDRRPVHIEIIGGNCKIEDPSGRFDAADFKTAGMATLKHIFALAAEGDASWASTLQSSVFAPLEADLVKAGYGSPTFRISAQAPYVLTFSTRLD